MKVFHSLDGCDFLAGGALAIGNFDGIHLGHQALLKSARSLRENAHAGVLTFDPHPAEILCPKEGHFSLSSLDQKIDIFSQLGLDAAIFQPVDHQFLSISPKQFVLALSKLKVKHVVVGEDFSFGQKAAGNVMLLKQMGKELGFLVHIVENVSVGGLRCSSTAIRTFLEVGDIKAASSMLGRYFSLRGEVVLGQQKGQLLGFPTANISPKNFYLKMGVYGSVTRIQPGLGQKDELSITNVGVRPTVSQDDKLLVETHLLSTSLTLYGREIEVFFVEKIRDEEKFPSLKALQEQVSKDCQKARQMKWETALLEVR